MPDCGSCRHFEDDGHRLEQLLPGLSILSSAHGETRGDQGLCRLYDRLLTPGMTCPRHEPQPGLEPEA